MLFVKTMMKWTRKVKSRLMHRNPFRSTTARRCAPGADHKHELTSLLPFDQTHITAEKLQFNFRVNFFRSSHLTMWCRWNVINVQPLQPISSPNLCRLIQVRHSMSPGLQQSWPTAHKTSLELVFISIYSFPPKAALWRRKSPCLFNIVNNIMN